MVKPKINQLLWDQAAAIRISVIYALVASVWIYASDALIALLARHPQQWSMLQTYRGWVFVAVTALLLYGLISNTLAAARVEQSLILEAGSSSRPRSEFTVPSLWSGVHTPIVIFFLLASAIGVTGHMVYRFQKEILQQDRQAELLAVADAKVDQISNWIAERRKDAELIARDPFISLEVKRWLSTGAVDDDHGTRLLAWLTNLKDTFGYTAVMLVDELGQVRLGTSAAQIDSDDRTTVLQAMRSGQVIVSDLHRQPAVGEIEIDVIAPLGHASAGDGQSIGAVYYRIDPGRNLFPLIQTWPMPSVSAETLLVRRDGNDVLYLNELRHRGNTALIFRLPPGLERLPAAMVTKGQAGVMEGVDYRQVRVLATSRQVSGTPWFLVAKIDADEVYAPIRIMALLVATLVGVFIIGAGVGTGLWWRQQYARFLADHYRGEMERRGLVQHFDYLARYANDMILLMDAEGRIIEANAKAMSAYGYTREELLSLEVSALSDPATREDIAEQMQKIKRSDGLVYETMHLRKDKSRFPVEVSSRLMEIEGHRFLQSIIRDVSERKRAEELAKQRQAELAHVSRLTTVSEMASGLAHELSQPLTAIANYCDAALDLLHADSEPPERLVYAVQQALGQTQRAGDIVQHLREFMRKSATEKTWIDLNTLIRETVAFITPEARGNMVTVNLALTDDLPRLWLDKIEIEQVLVNLLHNSIEAMDQADSAARQLTITTHLPTEDTVQVTVQDTGPGLHPDMLKYIFKPFQTTKTNGIGLGLAISHSIIEAHRGRLWTVPNADQGAIFHFTLPIPHQPAST